MSKLEIKDDGKDFVVVSGFPNQPTKLYLGRETGYEIFHRWNCRDDLVAACEKYQRMIELLFELNPKVEIVLGSALGLKQAEETGKAALAKAKE